MNNDQNKIIEIENLLKNLRKLLSEHRGKNHIAGINLAISEISNIDANPEQRLHATRLTFRTMMAGMGTLGDFVIWNENECKQVALNEELNNV